MLIRVRLHSIHAVLLLLLSCACAREDGSVKSGSRVRLDYSLAMDGKPFESTEMHGPIEIEQGHGDLPADVDRGLLGMRAGQHREFDLPAGAGFGPREAGKIESLPLAPMGAMGADVKPGKKILGFKDGKPVAGRVLEVRDGAALVDFNHPLAGKALRYRVQIAAIDPR